MPKAFPGSGLPALELAPLAVGTPLEGAKDRNDVVVVRRAPLGLVGLLLVVAVAGVLLRAGALRAASLRFEAAVSRVDLPISVLVARVFSIAHVIQCALFSSLPSNLSLSPPYTP